MTKNKGFTLIELLVVIAIIGILSSIVLASLNNARNRGNDAKTKAQLSGMRAAMELYYDTYKNYGTATDVCNTASTIFTDTIVAPYINNLPTGVTPGCRATATPGYAAYANLLSVTGYWCVDYKGNSKRVDAVPGNGIDVCS